MFFTLIILSGLVFLLIETAVINLFYRRVLFYISGLFLFSQVFLIWGLHSSLLLIIPILSPFLLKVCRIPSYFFDLDFYSACRALHVSPISSLTTINSAYLKRIAACHPDLGGHNEHAVRINSAREFLLKTKALSCD